MKKFSGLNVLLALENGPIRDELLLYFGHSGVRVYVSTIERQIKKSISSFNYDCLIFKMYYKNFDALEILLFMRDKGLNIPVFLLSNPNKKNFDLTMFHEVIKCFHSPFDTNEIFNEVYEKIANYGTLA